MARGGVSLCGYVLVPEGNVFYGIDDFGELSERLDVHGGITFTLDEGTGWWIGFDCAHADDAAIFYDNDGNVITAQGGRIWTEDEVEAETNRLADQLAGRDRHAP
jgi:hypothetical protein